MDQLSSRDAAYLFLGDRHDSATVVSVWVLRDRADGTSVSDDEVLSRLRALASLDDHFVSRVHHVPLSLGRPFWQRDPEFDMARHYFTHDDGLTWSGAIEEITRIGARPLAPDRPLWRAHLLRGVDGVPGQPGSSSLLAIMWHHAAFDGMRWTELTRYALADAGDDRGPAPDGWRVDDRRIGPRTAAVREIVSAPMTWTRFLVGVLGNLRPGERQVGSAGRPATVPCPPTRFTSSERGTRVCSYVPLPLSAILDIRRACPGATVNDVMLSVIGGALRDYLTHLGEPPASTLPALVPISTRTGTAGPVNQFAASIVDLHTDINDPLERITAVSASATAAKEHTRATQSARSPQLPGPLLRLLGGLSRSSRLNARPPLATVAITNIGPTRGVDTMAGSCVDAMYGMQTLSPGCLLAHSIRTVRDRLVVSVTTDDGVMADPYPYLRFIEDSVAAHRAAALVA